MLSASRNAPEFSSEPVLQEADAVSRGVLENFIADRFAEVYGARLYNFMPRLFGMRDADGDLLAAFGLRAAEQQAQRQALFLERYLDRPIEALIAGVVGRPLQRRHIVEVGNLAGASVGALRQLIPLLCERLHREGCQWIAFTGPARLCNSFTRLGLPLSVLAPAPLECLDAEERQCWGSYYAQQPSVMVGDIAVGIHQLRHLGADAGELKKWLAPLATVGAP